MVVKDVYFAYFLLGLIALAAVGYSVRLATRGVARSERVGRIGGTVLVNQELMDWTYWAVEPIVRALSALGITANNLTWSALVLGLGAGVALAWAQWGLATLLSTASVICDILDGQVARASKTGSSRGELLDAAVDRYTEFAFLAGLAIWFHDSAWRLALVLATMLACYMVSYASAKAEAMQVAPPRGLMRRHERSTFLILGIGLTSVLGDYLHARVPGLPDHSFVIAGLAMVAVIGNFAAVTRLVRIGRALR
ncbi:MAG TPA: CDP-alcohol phosphatidyltransferase family protein [Kofleriaceae bacterium]|nr:CDP-alcohol phosphatidyltransferase family protein [Kofleriaceae bacterium]